MRSTFAVLLLLLSASASAVTIDFESVPVSGPAWNTSGFDLDGMRFQSSTWSWSLAVYNEDYFIGSGGPTFPDPIGEQSLLVAGAGYSSNRIMPYVDLETLNGESFDFISFATGSDDEIRLTGVTAGGTAIYASNVALSGYELLVGTDLGNGFTSYSLSSEWGSLDFLRIEHAYNDSPYWEAFSLDNIVVNAVPIPAAVWLFGSALAGLGWLRRK